MEKKTQAFQAEVGEMLDLVVNSLYSKKEIFLRELISNASDAIDKAQYLGLTDKTLVSDSPEWAIGITLNKEAQTLTIIDNGIGMNAEEAEANLGTIAKSGTQAFMDSIKKNESSLPEMIGQFGVGFYAAFMVADTVTVETLRRGEGQVAVKWTSDGKGSYTIEDGTRTECGTTITLHLLGDNKDYLDAWEIKSLVKKYSDFISYPIRLSEDGKEIDKTSEALNTMKALWRKSKNEVKDEEYNEFYKHISHDYEPPLRKIHYSAEGQLEFKALLFIPSKPGMDLYMPNRKHGLQLYVRNVFIGSDFEELLPDYLRFVSGVVDSSDLPLNVSREMLQDDAIIRKMRSSIVLKIIADLEAFKKDKFDEYATFYRGFGKVIKEGLRSDYEREDKIKELLLFESDRTEEGRFTTLKDYKAAMKEGQKDIYYLKADSYENAKDSPQLEAFRKRGIDVLFFTDPIDDFVFETFTTYDGVNLKAIDKGEIELGTDEEKAEEKKNLDDAGKEYKALLDFIKDKLHEDVKDVRISSRLTDSACCLVAEEGAMTPGMVRMMKAMGQEVPKQKRILELNPKHPIMQRLADELKSEHRDDESLLSKIGALYDLALVGEGSQPRKPSDFVKLVSSIL